MERIRPRSSRPTDPARLDEVDRMGSDQVATELVSLVGAKITAAAGGVGATRLVREWMNKRPPLRPTALATALKAARAIADRDGEIVAQRWFVGTNRYLGHRSPLEVLADNSPEGRTKVMQAAIAFTE
jgi:hypothetical protein